MFQAFSGNYRQYQFELKHKDGRERQEKIVHFTGLLKDGTIDVAYFLLAMSGNDILMDEGSVVKFTQK